MSLCVAIVNESTSSPLASQLTPEWLQRCASACATQLARDVAPYWGTLVHLVRVALTPDAIQAGEMVFAIVDELPDAPGAVAYHDVDGNAVPFALLALSTCNTLDDVSQAISHELCETNADPDCNRWADDLLGHEYALEACDAVESNSYAIVTGDGSIVVSDFVLPAFFSPHSLGPFSYMQTVDGSMGPISPFSTDTGGYQIQRESGGGETTVQGVVKKHLAKRRHWSSRTYRRGVRLVGQPLQVGEV